MTNLHQDNYRYICVSYCTWLLLMRTTTNVKCHPPPIWHVWNVLLVSLQEKFISELGSLSVTGLTAKAKPRLVFSEGDFSADIFSIASEIGLLIQKYEESSRWQFFHKSAQEFCAGYYLSNNITRMERYLNEISTDKQVRNLALVLTFAARYTYTTDMIVRKITMTFDPVQFGHFYHETLPLKEALVIQELIELCLVCNFEARANINLKHLFPTGLVLFSGISVRAASALGYLMQCSDRPDIKSITLRPIAHASDPLVFFGPTGDIWHKGLQKMNHVEKYKIEQIRHRFIDANHPNLHRSLLDFSSTQFVAYIECIQACEGLPSTSDTDISPIIGNLKNIRLEHLDIDKSRLRGNFDILVKTIAQGHMKSLRVLFVREAASTGKQMTNLAEQLHQMPVLEVLSTATNEIEPWETFPAMCENFSKTLKVLYICNMKAPASISREIAT